MLDFNSLRIFVACANKGSFTAAAKGLSLPLPTVSRRMLELERDLKTQLFDRTSRGCTLTTAGAKLLIHVAPGIESLNEFESTSHLESPLLTGRLRLSVPQSFRPWWRLLSRFQQENPSIKVSVYSTERRVDFIADGVDVALRVGAIADDSVIAKKIGSFKHVLVASPKLAHITSRFTHPTDISQLRCATWGSSMDEQPIWTMGTVPMKVEASLMVNDYLQIMDRALAGDLLAELPYFLAAEHLCSGRLIEVLPEYPFPYSPVHLVYRRLRHPLAIVRTYVDFCAKHFPTYLDAPGEVPF